MDEPVVAVMVTLIVPIGAEVLILNVAVVCVAFTRIIVNGNCATGLLLLRDTTTPPAGAGLDRVTVPVEDPVPTMPPGTIVGFRVRLAIVGTGTGAGDSTTTS